MSLIVIVEDEVKSGILTIKDMSSGKEDKKKLLDLLN
jgi:histidyl-tRNA synthetase